MSYAQRDQPRVMVAQRGIARAQELRKAGIEGATIQRARKNGQIVWMVAASIGTCKAMSTRISRSPSVGPAWNDIRGKCP